MLENEVPRFFLVENLEERELLIVYGLTLQSRYLLLTSKNKSREILSIYRLRAKVFASFLTVFLASLRDVVKKI